MTKPSINPNRWSKCWLAGWRRVAAGVLILAALWLSAPFLLNRFARLLIRSEPLERSDVVVALGGDKLCLRERRAAELYLGGWAHKVIVSGVDYLPGLNTGDAAKRYVVHLGVPEADVIVMRQMLNTRVEARRLEVLMRENGWGSATIVTAPFHSRRALFTIERIAPDRRFRSYPTDPVAPEWQPNHWWRRRTDMYLTIREALAWINTLIGGWE